jgi:hypothetical protein
MPLGGLVTIETERAAVSQLVAASHRALTEMQTAIGALWPVMVGVGTGAETVSNTFDEPPITITQAYKMCDDLTRAVHTFTQAWIAADNSLHDR